MKKHHVFPWFMGLFLLSPLRLLYQNPRKIFSPYIKKGMSILEIGPGMGFFTLPLARITGSSGRVYAVDLQDKMLAVLKKRAALAGLSAIIKTVKCTEDSLHISNLNGEIDFATAFFVVHEIQDQKRLLSEIYSSLKEGGGLFIAEPAHIIGNDEFEKTIKTAAEVGFKISDRPSIKRSKAVLLHKAFQS
jgi:ubiquinone/menaquinone biosynthesis C-methylase UbiE